MNSISILAKTVTIKQICNLYAMQYEWGNILNMKPVLTHRYFHTYANKHEQLKSTNLCKYENQYKLYAVRT